MDQEATGVLGEDTKDLDPGTLGRYTDCRMCAATTAGVSDTMQVPAPYAVRTPVGILEKGVTNGRGD